MKRCPSCQGRYRDAALHCPFDGAQLAPLEDPLIGKLIGGRYAIEQKLGAGGMATVYRGRHQALDREVALKILHPELAKDEEHRQRFLREARAANRVHHPNVVDIVDIGQSEDGLVFLVMEYLRGVALSAEIEKGALPLSRACAIGYQIARALARAHVLGVVHRDVKPDNVFLVQSNAEGDAIKLLDFGLARSVGDAVLTKSNSLFGTPGYMAPEQIEGGVVGPAADLYALGCVLYEMLSGALPFSGSVPALLYQHVHAKVPSLREHRPDVPASLEALVGQLMDKIPARRPASAYQVADALQPLLGSKRPSVDALATTAADEARGPSAPATRAPDDPLQASELSELRRRATAFHDGRALPQWLSQTLSRMADLTEQVRSSRERLASSARDASSATDRSRATAMRIGHALDALASHDLALAARLGAAEQKLRDGLRALEPKAAALLRAAQRLEGAPGTAAGVQEQSLQTLVGQWASAQRAVIELEAACDALDRERDDLGFQISQLKGRLAACDAAAGAESSESAEREAALESELRAKIYALRLEADRVSEHLAHARA